MHPQLGSQGLALVGPLEWLCHGTIVVLDKGQHLGSQLFDRREAVVRDLGKGEPLEIQELIAHAAQLT
jgi:hypothetical protein